MIMVVSILAGASVAWLAFGLFFEDRDDFLECVRYYFTPDIISMFRGEWGEDWWAETKLWVYVALSVGSGVALNAGLHKWLG